MISFAHFDSFVPPHRVDQSPTLEHRGFRRLQCSALIFTLLAGITFQAASADQVLVPHGTVWTYRKGTNAFPSNWKTAADSALDPSWGSAKGGFGYADNANETSLCQQLLPDMKGRYSTLALRKSFEINSPLPTGSHLVLTIDYDDGFIAWLDGTFLASKNSPGSPAEPSYKAVATALHESSQGDGTRQPASVLDLGEIGNRLGVGTHVLALIGLNQDLGSSDFIQVADLSVTDRINTCLSGALSTDTLWKASESPIEICGTITVPSGVTLTVEPGTTIQLGAGVGLVVENGAKLLAEGTPEKPILFTKSPGQGNWDHITLHGNVGSPESRITHARFEFNASSTGIPCIEVAAGTAFLDHLQFSNTGAPYIHVDGASFVISECQFPSATAAFELVHGTGGIKSGGHGIFVRNFFGSPIGYNDVVDFTGGNRPGPIVHFIENVFAGSQDDGVDLDGTDAWVEGNIFLHVHRNGSTPDSSAAVSGGNDSGQTSEITVVRNLFFDCDNAATAKQGNFFTFLNNTAVHITKTGGIDGASGVVNVRDTTPAPTTFGRGYYLEGNILSDVEQLVRNYDATKVTVTLNTNLLPIAWSGPGSGNIEADPKFVHLPTLPETAFTNWADAQVLHQWFSLQTGSPGQGSGASGKDQGWEIPSGVSISGEPDSPTPATTARLQVGSLFSGFGIPTNGFPQGSGYVAYRWRLDGGAWSAETSTEVPIELSQLTEGEHLVEVSGKRDSGLYQDDPLFGPSASVTRSKIWKVQTAPQLTASLQQDTGTVHLTFQALGNTGYTLEYRDSLTTADWLPLVHLDPIPTPHPVDFQDPVATEALSRFYRVRVP